MSKNVKALFLFSLIQSLISQNITKSFSTQMTVVKKCASLPEMTQTVQVENCRLLKTGPPGCQHLGHSSLTIVQPKTKEDQLIIHKSVNHLKETIELKFIIQLLF